MSRYMILSFMLFGLVFTCLAQSTETEAPSSEAPKPENEEAQETPKTDDKAGGESDEPPKQPLTPPASEPKNNNRFGITWNPPDPRHFQRRIFTQLNFRNQDDDEEKKNNEKTRSINLGKNDTDNNGDIKKGDEASQAKISAPTNG